MLKFNEIPTRERKKLERLLELQDEMLKIIGHMESPLKVGVLDMDWSGKDMVGIFFGLYVGENNSVRSINSYVNCEEFEEEEI